MKTIELLEASRKQEETPSIVWIGDSGHQGTDVYWSDRIEQWVFVDLENRECRFADKIAVYRSEEDGDKTGLSQAAVLACDFDGPGLWVLGLDESDEPEPERDDAELVWSDFA